MSENHIPVEMIAEGRGVANYEKPFLGKRKHPITKFRCPHCGGYGSMIDFALTPENRMVCAGGCSMMSPEELADRTDTLPNELPVKWASYDTDTLNLGKITMTLRFYVDIRTAKISRYERFDEAIRPIALYEGLALSVQGRTRAAYSSSVAEVLYYMPDPEQRNRKTYTRKLADISERFPEFVYKGLIVPCQNDSSDTN